MTSPCSSAQVSGNTDLQNLPYREARNRFKRRYFQEALAGT